VSIDNTPNYVCVCCHKGTHVFETLDKITKSVILDSVWINMETVVVFDEPMKLSICL